MVIIYLISHPALKAPLRRRGGKRDTMYFIMTFTPGKKICSAKSAGKKVIREFAASYQSNLTTPFSLLYTIT